MLLDWTLAFLPILLILVLMVRFRWGAAKAGPAGWFAAMLIASTRFGAGLRVLAFAQVKALLLTMDVLLIIWAAFTLYRVADEAGAIRVIGDALPRLTPDRGMQALLIGWAFASFLQGVGGFGVPTAVTAPILVGLGFPPVTAVVVPSLGHAWSVTFGSLGSSFQALIASSGLPGEALAPTCAALLGLAGFGSGLTAAHAAQGWRAVRRLALAILLLGLTMGLAQFLAATQGLWNLAGFAGGLTGLITGYVMARWIAGRSHAPAENGPPGKAVALALSGYLALVALTLTIQLVEPVRAFLGQVIIEVPFPELRTSQGYITPAGFGRRIPLFRHAGAILAYAAVTAYLLYRRAGLYRQGSGRRILVGTAQRVLSSSLGISALVAMAVVMAHAGMTEILARGLAEGIGGTFPLVAPWIGALGAFMTGSNTNSNVVFGLLQTRTAQLLSYNLPIVLAAQTAGGAIGSVFAPTKVVVGASTAGLGGKEGTILRSLLLYCLPLIAAISLMVWLALEVNWP